LAIITGALAILTAVIDVITLVLDSMPPIPYPVIVSGYPVQEKPNIQPKEGVFMPSSDYIPSADPAFYECEKVLLAYVLQNFTK
jgi:hypothetical protein